MTVPWNDLVLVGGRWKMKMSEFFCFFFLFVFVLLLFVCFTNLENDSYSYLLNVKILVWEISVQTITQYQVCFEFYFVRDEIDNGV